MPEEPNYQEAAFLQSAPDLATCPPDRGAEVAFAGRSNAGKSSAINALTGQRKLARTSKTPGRTQLLNFFRLGEEWRLVDLPGYGYAKVPPATKARWQRHLFDYLRRRRSLRGLVLLMDIRHPMRDYDAELLNWAVEVELPVHILLTKADKLKTGRRKEVLMRLRDQLQEAGVEDLVSAQTFSSLKNSGMEPLRRQLNQWLAPAGPAAKNP